MSGEEESCKHWNVALMVYQRKNVSEIEVIRNVVIITYFIGDLVSSFPLSNFGPGSHELNVTAVSLNGEIATATLEFAGKK